MRTRLLIAVTVAGVILGSSLASAEDHPEEEPRRLPSKRETLAFLKANIPEAVESLNWIRKHEPREYDESLQGWAEFVVHYQETKKEDASTAGVLIKAERLEFQMGELVDKISETRNRKKREADIQKVKGMLEEIFDAQLKVREFDIKILKKEIAEISEMVKKRKQNKKKIIDRRFKQMFDDADEELDWW